MQDERFTALSEAVFYWGQAKNESMHSKIARGLFIRYAKNETGSYLGGWKSRLGVLDNRGSLYEQVLCEQKVEW